MTTLFLVLFVQSTKLPIVTITNNFLWNEHINYVVKKASKRLYFLVQFSKKGQSFLPNI